MGLTVFHSADWHLDSPFASFPEAQRRFLRQQQRRIPQLAADLCRREGCQLMLLAGDLFDDTPSRDTVQALKQTLQELEIPVFIAPGNHDYCRQGSVWLDGDWPKNVHIFTGGMRTLVLPELDCRIYGAGYTAMDCPPLLNGFRAQGSQRYRIALLHADPFHLQSPYCPVTAAQVRQSDLDLLALGHIHRAGSFRAGRTLCTWPGTPMGRGWDETGNRTCQIITLEDSASLRTISLDTPHFFALDADLSQGAEVLEELLPAAGSMDFYRVTLTGDTPADLDALSAKYAHLPNLEFIDETQPPVSPWQEEDEDTLRGIFFQMLHAAQRDADETDARRLQLAAEISRKLLDGKEVTL